MACPRQRRLLHAGYAVLLQRHRCRRPLHQAASGHRQCPGFLLRKRLGEIDGHLVRSTFSDESGTELRNLGFLLLHKAHYGTVLAPEKKQQLNPRPGICRLLMAYLPCLAVPLYVLLRVLPVAHPFSTAYPYAKHGRRA